eukprot:431537_1
MDSTLNQLVILGFHPNKIRSALLSMDRGHNYDINKIIAQINTQRMHKVLHKSRSNIILCPSCHHVAVATDLCCIKCCNQHIKHKKIQTNTIQNDIHRLIAYIQQIISNKRRQDIKLKIRESQKTISSLKLSIQQTQHHNVTLKQKMNALNKSNKDRFHRLKQLKSEHRLKWPIVLQLIMKNNTQSKNEYKEIKELCSNQSVLNVLQLCDYYVMNTNQHEQRAMIQNVVVPLQFTIENINKFYVCHAFRYPLPEIKDKDCVPQHCIHIEHGICASLYHIVSFLKHVCRYLSVDMMYPMHLSRSKGAFIEDNMDYRLSCSNYKDSDIYHDFEYALDLLHQNISYLCTQYGIKQHKLKYCAFIDNLMMFRKCLMDRQRLLRVNTNKRNKRHINDLHFTEEEILTDDSDEWEKI